MHITVMLTARSDGYKCKPFVLLNRKRQMPDVIQKYKGKLNLSWNGKVWMDNDLTEDYLRCTFGPAFFGHRRLLVWDSFRCHISEGTKKILKELKLDTAVVPGGCTKFIQAPDVSWNQPFKAKLKHLFDDWMANGEKSFTKGRNPRPPSVDVYLGWVVEAWESVSVETVERSFKSW
jgi:DDE superfamily endonuclease